MLLGRRAECEAISAALDAARRGSSAALVLRGEPGIGKTALLDYAAESAPDMQVARVAGFAAEAGLGFAGLHRLVSPFLAQLGSLPPRLRDALGAAFGLAAEVPANPFLVGLATLTLLSRAATDDGPLLCLVDDAHWLDPDSLQTLAFAGRRLHTESLALMLAVRDPADKMPSVEGLPSVQISGLDLANVTALLSGLGRSVDRETTARIVTETGGNPLAITELAGEFTSDQLGRRAVLPQPLPLTRRMESRFLRQVEPMPVQTRTLLLAAAAESSGDPDTLWRACGVMGVSPGAARAAEDAGLLTLQPQVTFRHPLIRSAVYSGATETERRQVHSALAAVIDQDQDPDRQAWHLAAAAMGPDEEVAARLERSAERIRRRGGLAAAVMLLSRAAELSSCPHRRAERFLAGASLALLRGDIRHVRALLALAVPGLKTPVEQAVAQRLEASVLRHQGKPAQAAPILLSAARAFEPLDPQLATETWLEAFGAAIDSHSPVLDIARTALKGLRSGPSRAGAADTLLHGLATRFTDGYAPAVPYFRQALADLAVARPPANLVHWIAFADYAAQEILDAEARRPILERFVGFTRDRATLTGLRIALRFLAQCEIGSGRFAAAEACFAETRDITAAVGQDVAIWEFPVVELRAWQGDVARTRSAVGAFEASADKRTVGDQQVYAKRALVILELGLGRYREALAPAQWIYAEDPPATGNLPLADLVEAGMRGGDQTAAAAALTRLMDRATASGTPWAAGLLARSMALVADDDAAGQFYEAAIGHLAGPHTVTDLARSHLLYGEWLRRQKRRTDARAQLRLAYEGFHSMGAAGFAERARLELAATGETAPKRNADRIRQLTPQEFQVASLAAAGATNDEIATQLFLSSKTVAYHLSKTFRKLDVTSRRQLRHLHLDGTGRDATAASEGPRVGTVPAS